MLMEMKLNTIKDNLFIFFGFTIVAYILIIRLFINKLPRDLPTIRSPFELIYYSLVPLFFVLLAILAMLQYYKKFNNSKYSSSFKIISYFSKFYWKSLLSLDAIIKNNISPKILGENLLRFGFFYTNHLRLHTKKSDYIFIYVSFNFIPKVLFIICFFLDVFYLKKFTYIYYYGWILLIPIAFNYLVFTLKEFSEHNLDRYVKVILVVIDDCNFLVENKQTILESCKNLASDLYFCTKSATQFKPTLYSKICDSYLEDNNITDFEEICRVDSLRQKEFIMFRVIQTQALIFGHVRDHLNSIFNTFYFFCFAVIWVYILLQSYIF